MKLEVVRTKYGLVKGVPGANPDIAVFKKIPFAKPPVGKLRFAAPEEPEAWEGELLCDTFSDACIQGRWPGDDFGVSEDCLYLNVYAPANPAQEKLPVFFWIFGGAFRGGSAFGPETCGEAMAAKGAVVVTINYRCNVFGFFSTKELEERTGFVGNVGLLDQIAALKWTKENIAAFGGDPERVLIYGQSAGGISVRMLLTSPLSRGLFSRAVVQSGGGLNEADPVRPKEEFQQLCQECLNRLGWTLDDLMEKDPLEIQKRMEDTAHALLAGKELALFQPFLDGYTLLEVPGKCIARGEYADVPVICGTVAGDSWMFSRKVREQLQGERYFRGFSYAPSQSWGRRQLELGRAPIYAYYMERTQPPKKQTYAHGAPPFGASTPHGAEIAYVFGTLGVLRQAHTEYDYEISRVMMEYWLNFARTGTPNGAGLPEWPAFEGEERKTLHITDDGICAENVVASAEEERTVTYTMEHPGMLESLEGF